MEILASRVFICISRSANGWTVNVFMDGGWVTTLEAPTVLDALDLVKETIRGVQN